MRGLTFHGKGDIRYESVPDPVIETPTDAIVRLRLGAICGSDLHVYHERERGLDRGTVMGHEFVGEVVEVGPGVERKFGSFRRSFTLPSGVDADKVEAKFAHGVLTLDLPKAEAAKPRRIAVS